MIANISHDYTKTYTGTAVPTDYKFVCWLGDDNEKQLVDEVFEQGLEIIQVEIPKE